MKKILGIALMLFGIVGLFGLFSDFNFSYLIISIAFIGLGYYLFAKPTKKVTKKTTIETKDEYPDYENDEFSDYEDELDEDEEEYTYIAPKYRPKKSAHIKMFAAGSKYGERQNNIKSIYEKYNEIDGINNLELIPDPDNKFNPDAIRVKLDGLDIGFIPDKQLARLKRFIELHPNYTYWWWIKLPSNDEYNQYSVSLRFYD